MYIPLLLSVALAGSAVDRCETRNCMCRVETQVTQSQLVTQVLFEEDSSRLTSSQSHKLDQWTGRNPLVIATTDGCGQAWYNQELAASRAASVLQVIDGKPIVLGERKPHHDPASRRVLVVDRNARMLKALAAWPADYYLLDASGSMSDDWRQIQQFPFPTGSQVWVAKTHDCTQSQQLKTIYPAGPTEIWHPYWMLVKQARPGSRILIASDFRSRVPLSAYAAQLIESKVKEKRLVVKVVRY